MTTTSGDEYWRTADQHLLGLPSTTPDEEAAERNRARRLILHGPDREGCTHACVNPGHDSDPDACAHIYACINPGHRRDLAAVEELLDALGLAGTGMPGPDGDKRCARCGEEKPRSAFPKRSRHRDGRDYTCTDCRNARRRAAYTTRGGYRGSYDGRHDWEVSRTGGHGIPCSRAAVSDRISTWEILRVTEGRTPREAARAMRISMRSARRYDRVLRERGVLPGGDKTRQAVA